MEQHSNQYAPSQKIKRGPAHEGPKKHFIAYAISMVLTLLAFVAVLNENLSTTFIYAFIVMMAIVQVVVQLYYWMHMKDRGHIYAKVGIAMGSIVALTAVITALYWVWW